MSNSIAYGQEYIRITRDEQRACLKWYSENLYKDSIIIIKDTIINTQTNHLEAHRQTITKLEADNTTLNKKVRRNRRIAIGGIGGFLGSLILLFIIK